MYLLYSARHCGSPVIVNSHGLSLKLVLAQIDLSVLNTNQSNQVSVTAGV